MQALKLKGKVDEAGRLVVAESISFPPGAVEVVVWPIVQSEELDTLEDQPVSVENEAPPKLENTFQTKVNALTDWFEEVSPAPQDFDADEARWQALREKYRL